MSLQIWLPLNESLENKGLSDITVINYGATIDNNGKFGKCYSFDGTSIAVPELFKTNISEFSICAWVKLLDGYALNNGCHLISVDNDLRICVSKDGHAIGFIANNASIITGSTLNYSNLTSNRWYHFAITFKDGIVSYYIDGMKDSETNIGIEQLKNIGNKSYHIGSYGSESSKSCISDYRLYSHCLSPLEVKQISQGLVCHYKLSGVGGENILVNSGNYTIDTPLTVSSNARDGWNQSINLYATLEAGTKYTLSAKQDGTWISGHNTSGVDYTKKYNSLWLYLKDGTSYNFLNMTNGYVNFTPTKSGTYYIRTNTYSDGTNTVTVNYWDIKLEEGSKATPWCPNPSDTLYSTLGYNDGIEYDCSGYGNNGTKVGNIAWSGDSARYNGSYDFNGTGYVKNTSFNINTTQMTISFWVKISQTITSQHFLFGTFNSWTGNGIGYWRDVGNNYYSGILKSFAESSHVSLATPALTANTWYHIAIVYTGTECILYVNGVENKRVTYGKNGTIANPVCYLGNSLFNNTPSSETDESSMSDFRIYATALSSDDIKALYSTSASIDKTGVLFCGEIMEGE